MRLTVSSIGLASAVLLATAPAWGQPSPPASSPIPIESFFRHPDIGDAKLSPSGRKVAVTTGIGGSRIGLVVFDLQSPGAPKQAARYDNADIRSFYWLNEERLVYNVIDLAQGGAEQRIVPGVYSVRPDGSERSLHVDMGNHALLHVPRGGGEDVIVGEFKGDGLNQRVNALRLDVTTGRMTSLSYGVPPNAKRWLFDPKGEPRLIVAVREGVTRIHWRAPGKDGWIELARFDSLAPPFSPAFVDASGELYVTTSEGAAGTSVLKRFDFDIGKPHPDPVVSAPGFDVVARLATDGQTGKTLGVRVLTDADTTVWFGPRMKALQQSVDNKLPGRINRIDCSRCEATDAVALVHSWSDQDPGQYWIYRPDGERWTMVGPARKDIEPRQMATLDFHRIKARDGLDLPVWVTTPNKSQTTVAPRAAVVLVHGGPFVRGGSWRWDAQAQFLASRGYVVIEPEFRGSTGFGDRHFRAGWKQWGLAMQDDVADAVLWAIDKGWVDRKRVCIAGASYGGYATLMGLVRHPDLYRCGAAWVAVTDPRLLFELDWISDLSEEYKKFGLPAMLGDPVADAAMLKAVAPVEQASRIKAPLLLAFGVQDRRVPIEHGNSMRAALRAAGQEAEWITYAGEGHGWLRFENRVDFERRLESFLDKHLRP